MLLNFLVLEKKAVGKREDIHALANVRSGNLMDSNMPRKDISHSQTLYKSNYTGDYPHQTHNAYGYINIKAILQRKKTAEKRMETLHGAPSPGLFL